MRIEEAEEPCNSTEDFLTRIEIMNEADLEGYVIGSMDVAALYPSMDIEFSVDKSVELIRESQVQFDEVNYDELGLYLVLCVEEEQLRQENLLQYCPTLKDSRVYLILSLIHI